MEEATSTRSIIQPINNFKKSKIFQILTITFLFITMLGCGEKENDELTIILPKDAKVDGNPYSKKGLLVKGPIELKGDYKVEYDSIKKIALLMNPSGNGIAGEFDCDCTGGEGGGCKLILRPNAMSCQMTICNNCSMEIVIIDTAYQLNIAYK